MTTFFKQLLFFFFFLFFVTEILSRLFHISTDAPKTYKNYDNVINYYSNQEGYWDGGKHKWYINRLGYPGKNLPIDFNNLVLLIGDSYIQNFMNPDSCRQREYLSKLQPKYNFMEVSIAGLNLLGYFEYSKKLDTLNPKYKLIYISSGDFKNNITNNNKNIGKGYRINLENEKISYPKYRGSRFKDFIYNFKYIYYLYRKNISFFEGENQGVNNSYKKQDSLMFSIKEYDQISKLLDIIKKNYNTHNVIFVFHPNSDKGLISLTKSKGFEVLELNKEENVNWKTKKDGHWNCFAHKKVATQISLYLDKIQSRNY